MGGFPLIRIFLQVYFIGYTDHSIITKGQKVKKVFITTILSSVLLGNAYAECTYNFDANQTQLNAISTQAIPFPNVSGQKASIILAASNTYKTYIAVSSGYGTNKVNQPTTDEGDKVLSQSNIIAYEMIIKAPNISLTGNSVLALMPGAFMGTKDGKNVLMNMLASFNNIPAQPNLIFSGWHVADVSTGNVLSENTLSNTDVNNGVRVGFYINQQTQQVGVIANGNNLGYIGSYSVKPSKGYFTINLGVQNIPTGSPLIGKEVSVELITDHTKLQNTYPTGAQDICGNVI